MKCIVGLGNPGREYEKSRHNAGFLVVDALAESYHSVFSKKRDYFVARIKIGQEEVALVKPTTFMNLSGVAVSACFEKMGHLTVQDLLVISDDVNLPLGSIRFRTKGSAGGHHGLESIISELGTGNFPRLRIGVGCEGLAGKDLTSFVLGSFDDAEWRCLSVVLPRATQACIDWIFESSETIMSRYNKESPNIV